MSSIIFNNLLAVENSPEKMTEQVGFKVTVQTFGKLQAAAIGERRKRNEFARLLFEWALEKFAEVGSYDALIGRVHGSVLPYHSVPSPLGVNTQPRPIHPDAQLLLDRLNEVRPKSHEVSLGERKSQETDRSDKERRKRKDNPTGTE